MRRLQAWRTPSDAGLACSSAGLGLPVLEQAANAASTTADIARRKAGAVGEAERKIFSMIRFTG